MELATVYPDQPIELTERGWPRPRRKSVHDGEVYPVAWATEAPYFAQISEQRGHEMVEKKLCQICGEGHDPGARVVLFLTGGLRDREAHEDVGYTEIWTPTLAAQTAIRCLDDAIMHDRCARLAVGTCPHLKRARDGDRLFGFTAPIEDVHHHKGPLSYLYALGTNARVWKPR